MFIDPVRVSQNLNRIATPTRANRFAFPPQTLKGIQHDAKPPKTPRASSRDITLAKDNATAPDYPGAHSKLAQALGGMAEEPPRLESRKTSDYPIYDGSSAITQAAIDALCAPLKKSIMNNRKRTRRAFLLTIATANLLLASTSIQVAHAANPLDPSFYQWRSVPRNASVALEAPTLGEQRNPLSPAYQLRADLRWKTVVEESVRADTYRAQTHPLHPSFNRATAS